MTRFLGTDKTDLEKIDENNFIVRVNQDRTVINKVKDEDLDAPVQNKYAFMAEMEKDAARRFAERKEREQLAQSLRK